MAWRVASATVHLTLANVICDPCVEDLSLHTTSTSAVFTAQDHRTHYTACRPHAASPRVLPPVPNKLWPSVPTQTKSPNPPCPLPARRNPPSRPQIPRDFKRPSPISRPRRLRQKMNTHHFQNSSWKVRELLRSEARARRRSRM